MDIAIKDSIFDPSLDPKARSTVYVREATKPLYKVWIYLEGKDLPFVDRVTYRLHETFPDPVRTVQRTVANPRCELVIWTWGIFDVQARIVDKQGRVYDLKQRLSYDRELAKDGLKSKYV